MSRGAEVTWGTEGGRKVWQPQGVVCLRVAPIPCRPCHCSWPRLLAPPCHSQPAAGRAARPAPPALPCPALSLHSLAGDEGDKLGEALLHRLLGVLGNLGVGRQHPLHDAADVGDGQVAVLVPAWRAGEGQAVAGHLWAREAEQQRKRRAARRRPTPAAAGAHPPCDLGYALPGSSTPHISGGRA